MVVDLSCGAVIAIVAAFAVCIAITEVCVTIRAYIDRKR